MSALASDALRIHRLAEGERRPVLQVFEGLSERSRRLRFLGPKPVLREAELDRLVDVGCCGRQAVVATDPATGDAVGIARYVRLGADLQTAEVAFEVVDAWQGRGVGKQLVHALRGLARGEGILRFRALVAHGNEPALALVRGVGDVLSRRYVDGEIELVVRLP
jgi:GNAT superfamily N-acetyltransferase